MKSPKLTSVFRISEKMENVMKNRKFVWVAGPNMPGEEGIKPGFKVPAWDIKGASSHRPRAMAERKLEAVRKANFPDKPSRIGCKFVFADVFATRKWVGGKGDAYQVEVTGKVFYTELELYTQIVFDYMEIEGLSDMGKRYDALEARINRLAEQYWEGVSQTANPRAGKGKGVECLVDGEVTVVKALNRDNVDKMKDKEDPDYEAPSRTGAHK